MLRADELLQLHDLANCQWHLEQDAGLAQAPALASRDSFAPDELGPLVLAEHRANFDLWHNEDEARGPDAGSGTLARVKRAIDAHNQVRNDLVERIDRLLFAEAGDQNEAAALHSETPGQIIDRLSILSLKIFHTADEACRERAPQGHREKNAGRLCVLAEQRDDLARCLDELWANVLGGARRWKLYRQMKMYNDPELNPVLYRQTR